VALLPGLALAQGNAEKGKALFGQYCAACHGPSGKGDAPAAAALNPKPKDLTDKAYMAGLKDQYLFDLIQKGGAAVGKSPLIPPFGAQLKDGDIRDVIAFVRSLAK
jgi:mono/diheme cytochrome c family protein